MSESEPQVESIDTLVVLLHAQADQAERTPRAADERVLTASIERDAATVLLSDIRGALTALQSAASRGHYILTSRPAMPAVVLPGASLAPADVLREIFEYVGEEYDYRAEKPVCALPPGFAVASVSRHWRNVALATPQLWARARLTMSPATYPFISERLGTILQRSKAEPLNLMVVAHPRGRNALPDIFTDTTVIRAMSRCQSLHFSCDGETSSFDPFNLLLLLCPMPVLRTLSVTQIGGLSSSLCLVRTDDLQGLTLSPLLETLNLEILPFSFIDPFTMPLVRTAIIRGKLKLRDITAISRAWPVLTSLKTYDIEWPTNVTPELELSALKVLVCASSYDSIISWLDHTHMPKLRELTFRCCSERASDTISHFLRPGPCDSLRILTVSGEHVALICSELHALPNLHTLVFSSVKPDALFALFKEWSVRSNVSNPPQLRTVRFRHCEFSAFTTIRLIGFLCRRKSEAADHPIRAIDIYQALTVPNTESVFPPWLHPRLLQLVERATINTAGAPTANNVPRTTV